MRWVLHRGLIKAEKPFASDLPAKKKNCPKWRNVFGEDRRKKSFFFSGKNLLFEICCSHPM